jgi:hypothetical protein
MHILGYVLLALITVVVALASAFVVATLPDFARYLRMRRM